VHGLILCKELVLSYSSFKELDIYILRSAKEEHMMQETMYDGSANIASEFLNVTPI